MACNARKAAGGRAEMVEKKERERMCGRGKRKGEEIGYFFPLPLPGNVSFPFSVFVAFLISFLFPVLFFLLVRARISSKHLRPPKNFNAITHFTDAKAFSQFFPASTNFFFLSFVRAIDLRPLPSFLPLLLPLSSEPLLRKQPLQRRRRRTNTFSSS